MIQIRPHCSVWYGMSLVVKFRCVQVRSANVLQVHTVDTVYQCHASPQEARRACPSKQDIRQQRAR